jgi:hypothetical protein
MNEILKKAKELVELFREAGENQIIRVETW